MQLIQISRRRKSMSDLFDSHHFSSIHRFYRVGPKKMSVMDEYYDTFVGEDVQDDEYYNEYYDDK